MRLLESSAFTPEELTQLEGVPVLDPDGLDKAIIGARPNAVGDFVIVYDYEMLVDAFVDEGVTQDEEIAAYEEAEEWVQYNTLRSLPYMGPRAPVVLLRVDDPDSVDSGELVEFKGKKWVMA